MKFVLQLLIVSFHLKDENCTTFYYYNINCDQVKSVVPLFRPYQKLSALVQQMQCKPDSLLK